MDRKFKVKGFSQKAKIDVWDMMTMLDVQKKEEEDKLKAQEKKIE